VIKGKARRTQFGTWLPCTIALWRVPSGVHAGPVRVWVREIIIVAKSGSRDTYVTPPAVTDFIERYDSSTLEFESPKPFSFTLEHAN
jgi:hypothetical protein